jgi:mannose-6-phosphate isomerase-like protein (cupin superfamily)
MVISINNSEHYHWGNNCDGWHLLKSDNLSVIQERMPPATEELPHYHVLAQQVFYILSGTATFVLDDNLIVAEANQSVIIPRGVKHSIKNLSNFDLHFLVISEPKAHGDRVNI